MLCYRKPYNLFYYYGIMNEFKKLVIGLLISLPVFYFGYLSFNRAANSFKGRIIDKTKVWIPSGSHPADLEAHFDGYSIVTERFLRYFEGKLKDTIRIPIPNQDYYIKKTNSFLFEKVWAEQAEDVIKLKNEQMATLEDSLKIGKYVRVWVGKENLNKTYHTITPDKISLLQG